MAPPTIIAHKSTFISTQTLHLSQLLEPTAAWRATNEGAQYGLPARVVDDAVYRLNHILTQHARRVYAPQASRHVAEQIEGLFHAEAQRALRGVEDDDDGGEGEEDSSGGGGGGERGEKRSLRIGADFTTDEAVASLPPTWDLQRPHETSSHPLEARRYAELTAQLTSLSARRRQVRERVERLRRMAALLAPFDESSKSGDDDDDKPNSTVQDNLVTRNGEMERELERMRLLLVRVAGRVAQLPEKPRAAVEAATASLCEKDEDADLMDIDSLEQVKIRRLLDGL